MLNKSSYTVAAAAAATTTTTTTTTTTIYIRLTAFFPGQLTWVSRHQKDKQFRILLEQEQELMGWQWHKLDHIQIICTSIQTDPRHYLTTQFLPARCPSCRPTNSVKVLKLFLSTHSNTCIDTG